MKRIAFPLAWLVASLSAAHSAELGRCAPLEFSAAGYRNVTEAGDIRVLPTDQVILINKRDPEVTRVVFGAATSNHAPVVIIKDCAGTARRFVVTISGEIDTGEVLIDGNFGSQSLRRVGKRWMIQ